VGGSSSSEEAQRQELIGALESSDRDRLAQAVESAISRVGESEELDALLLRAILVQGDPLTMEEIQRKRGGLSLDFYHPVVEQVVARAGREEASWTDLESALQDCQFLDAEPRRGLGEVQGRVVSDLPAVAYRLGAHRVVLGRPEHLADPDPMDGRGDLKCRTLRLVPGATLPQRIPRRLVFGATDGKSNLYISIRPEEAEAQAFVTNSIRDAERLLDAGRWWENAGEERETELLERFGTGLSAP
jgi:hypothetical protein